MNFERWLKQQINELEFFEFDETTGDHLAEVVTEAGRLASLAGLPEAVKACQIREGGVGIGLARVILARCLEASNGNRPEEKPPAPTNGPLTVKQAAEFLNVSPKTIYAACEAGTLRHLRIGEGRGTIRITRADLAAFNRQNQTAVAPKDYLS